MFRHGALAQGVISIQSLSVSSLAVTMVLAGFNGLFKFLFRSLLATSSANEPAAQRAILMTSIASAADPKNNVAGTTTNLVTVIAIVGAFHKSKACFTSRGKVSITRGQ